MSSRRSCKEGTAAWRPYYTAVGRVMPRATSPRRGQSDALLRCDAHVLGSVAKQAILTYIVFLHLFS
uniref:Uncharacterized protein n=1 Tax=Steinernema glaseri TaxID=37863 RepID=A0A1I7ZWV3_9BILA